MEFSLFHVFTSDRKQANRQLRVKREKVLAFWEFASKRGDYLDLCQAGANKHNKAELRNKSRLTNSRPGVRINGIVDLTITSLIPPAQVGKRAASVLPMVTFSIGFHLS